MNWFEWIVVIWCVGILIAGIDSLLGLRRLVRLKTVEPIGAGAPLVSVIVPARNEARGVEAGVRSMLAQQYSALEVMAVDDRSTDETGAILDRLAATEPRLRVAHLTELPPGWLGKNHALAAGAALAQGEFLLFADADVVLAPDTLSRAIGRMTQSGIDHLTVLPDLILPGVLRSFAVGFVVWFSGYIRPWKASDPKSRCSVGVGAFNLVRRSAYERAGGHERIRLRPDDDLKLGKIMKQSGGRAEALSGRGMISVEWYHSIGEAIEGLMKNTFAVVEYRPLLLLGGAVVALLVGLVPVATALLGHGAVAWVGLATVLGQLVVHCLAAEEAGEPWHAGLLVPFAAVLMAWIMTRALVLNLWQGGIVWRGTFYSLAELRRNRV